MINGWNQIDYNRMASLAAEKNIGYFLRKISREGEIPKNKRRRSPERVRVKTSKYKGVVYSACYKNPWKATYRSKYLGTFKTEQEAHEAYLKYEKFAKLQEELPHKDNEENPQMDVVKNILMIGIPR